MNCMESLLADSVKDQFLWVTKEMIDVSAVGIDSLLVCLMRQIVGGDFSDGNLWVVSKPKLEMLRQLEIEFCVKMLREQFHISLKIGRDLVRLLQDLVHVPEFKSIWKDLVLNPSEFRTAEFSDILQLYCTRTSNWKNYIEANGKLALFYDWLFFNEKMDNIMNIEPAMLLMVCSLPKYIDFTHSLLEFLLLLMDNYDLDHKNLIVGGVSSAFSTLVQKGVVHSLDVLTHCDALSPSIRDRLLNLLLNSQGKVPRDLLPVDLPGHSMPSLSLPDVSCMGSPTPSPKEQLTCEDGLSTRAVVASFPVLDNSVNTSTLLVVAGDNEVDAIESLVENIGEMIRESHTRGLQTLEAILLSIVNQCNQRPTSNMIYLLSKIANEFESNGNQLFTSLGSLPDIVECDDEICSAQP
ncbi:hypothetical protein CRYUN_Cryun03dG0123600 [Craigia yunnanensis]